MPDDRAKEVIKRQEGLASDRGTWESHWQEIAERVLPRQAEFITERTPGEKRTEKIFDSTAALALERFSAAMESMLTPRSQTWHRLRASDERLNDRQPVIEWFDEVNQILNAARYSPSANYSSQQHEVYMSLGAFGSGVLFVGEEPGTLRYRAIHLAECFFSENAAGMVDTNYRRFEYTARQAAEAFGEDNLPDRIKQRLDQNKPDEKFTFIHAVMPRRDRNPDRDDAANMPFSSTYVNVETQEVVTESGFQEFPYMISRYVTAPREVYGRSPAMTVLPDIKMLNEMSKSVIRQAHKIIDPPLLVADDGVLNRVNLAPGAINRGGVDEQGRQKAQPLQSGGRVDIGVDLMEQRRGVINDAFLVTLFQILVDQPQMTATEVLQRAQEKGALLAPTIGRQQSEALGPMIERELAILARAGMLPPMPEELIEAEGEFEIEYDSPLSRAQRSEEALGIQRTIELVSPLAEAQPQLLDNFDIDEVARRAPDVFGVSWMLRGQEQVQAIRQRRQQQEQAEQALQAAPVAAESVAKIAQVTNDRGR